MVQRHIPLQGIRATPRTDLHRCCALSFENAIGRKEADRVGGLKAAAHVSIPLRTWRGLPYHADLGAETLVMCRLLPVRKPAASQLRYLICGVALRPNHLRSEYPSQRRRHRKMVFEVNLSL